LPRSARLSILAHRIRRCCVSVAHPPITSSTLIALRPALREGLIALRLPEALDEPLLAYLGLLAQWNQAYNLTAIRDPAEMLVKHLFDSLVIHPYLPINARLVDIGSGAGLPAIPLALARADLRVTLIETAGKKARFLREAVRALGLGERVRVLAARAEAVDEAGSYDCLSARAFGTLAQILAIGGHLLRPGGQLIALKGRDPVAELAELGPGWRHVATHPLVVPGLDAERCLCVVEASTPAAHG